MEVPPGFHMVDDSLTCSHTAAQNINSHDYVLKLHKNLYGLKQARYNWFLKLHQGLLDCGFTQSKVNLCLFWKDDVFLVAYMDDCLIFAKTDDTIDGLIDSLCLDFNLTDEGDVSSFLGIDMKNLPDGSYELMQPGFIDQIIHKDGLELELKEHSTPVTTKLKSKDKDSEAWEYTWNYRKGIGMLNYLSATTQKDILFATHQCAHFVNKPM